MKRIQCLMALCAVFALPSTWAATNIHYKVGVVDLEQILHHSKQVKQMNARLEKKFSKTHKALQAKHQQLGKDFKNFQRNSSVMSKSKKKTVMLDLQNREKALSKEQMHFSQQVMREQKRASDKLLTQLRSVVKKIAIKEHFDLIVEKRSAFFSKREKDVTNKVSAAFE